METFSISNVSIKFSISMCFVETTNMPSSTNARNRYFGAFVYFFEIFTTGRNTNTPSVSKYGLRWCSSGVNEPAGITGAKE
jgi:hypothetical protein